MKTVICGGSGFIGKALSSFWLNQGHEVIIIGRNLPTAKSSDFKLQYYTWDQFNAHPELLEGTDALVNLAGASLSQRWTSKGKEAIISSRMITVSNVAKLISALKQKPAVVVQASAVAIYGTSLVATFDETSPETVNDFPSSVVQKWETAADKISGVRLVKLRVSVVLGNDGGAFPMMRLPYKLGVGGRIGTGRQWMSWIHIDDIIRLIDFCVNTPSICGPVNASAPEPVTNDEFGRTVASVYHRPHWFPVPTFLMKGVLGELSLIILEGQRVIPVKALEHGFQYTYNTLKEALRELKDNS
ncbi:TIGR01777 family oxidoreductase [Paenibacillus pini]|uniref:Cell division inhibitor n=1 Tax=Paenibacillus pini JCM 16418 TaxID=1236976 RepID=W7YBK9_9BACL|nr:TIGR01777 family oxidoreductase [Paenibacillus pini]GAF08215.1 cell division inhibitor [Paenibacillus pini JCM 16418]